MSPCRAAISYSFVTSLVTDALMKALYPHQDKPKIMIDPIRLVPLFLDSVILSGFGPVTVMAADCPQRGQF